MSRMHTPDVGVARVGLQVEVGEQVGGNVCLSAVVDSPAVQIFEVVDCTGVGIACGD